jgi:hypothetical protein
MSVRPGYGRKPRTPPKRAKEPSPMSEGEDELPEEEEEAKVEIQDLSCLQKLIKNFKFTDVLGVGVYGFTLLMIDQPNNQIVLKVQNTDSNSYRDIVNSLMLVNNLNIAIFTRILNWSICEEFPDEWIEQFKTMYKEIQKLQQKKGISEKEKQKLNAKQQKLNKAWDLMEEDSFHPPYSYITYEKNDHNIRDIDLTDDEVKSIIFILLHGIMTARKSYPDFNHTDIHGGNMMLNNHDPNSPIILDNGKFIIRNLKYFPKLIDYGLTRFSKKYNNRKQRKKEINSFGGGYPPQNDVYRIFYVFNWDNERWLGVRKGGYKNVISDEYMKTFDTQKISTFVTGWEPIMELLNHKILESPNIEHHEESESTEKRSRLTAFCNSCYSQNAKWTYHNTRDSYFFCDAKCAEKFEHIRKILPLKGLK